MSDEQSPPPTESEEADLFLNGDFNDLRGPATRKLQLLRLGALLLGVFEDEIATIAEWRQPTPLPHAPAAVLGVVSVQGRVLTVLDPSLLLGQTANQNGFAWRYIVALRGDEQLALAIEDKGETLALQVSDLNSPPATASRAVLGAMSHGDQLISVIETKELFPTAILGRERRQRRF
ncbi:MAG: chemotaxis protein CheW [Pyrinomonadaceae bacterium]